MVMIKLTLAPRHMPEIEASGGVEPMPTMPRVIIQQHMLSASSEKQPHDEVLYLEHPRYLTWVAEGVNMMQQGGSVVLGRANR